MGNIKKTVLLASVLALSSTIAAELQPVKVYAATVNDGSTGTTGTVTGTTGTTTGSTSATTQLTEEERIINLVNEGNATYDDYKKLGIGVRMDYVPIVNKAIKDARALSTINFTKQEIKEKIAVISTNIGNCIKRIGLGEATVADYIYLQIDKVNDNNVSDINKWLKGKYTQIPKIAERVEKILTAVSNINNGTDDENYYYTLGISNFNTSNIPLLKKVINEEKVAKGRDLTSEEIRTLVNNTLDKINAVLDKLDKGIAEIEDYKFIEATDVNEINLADVNQWLTGKQCTEVNQVIDEIKLIVEPLNKINTGSEETIDYESLEIYDVDNSNLENVRAVVSDKKAIKGAYLTKAEIKNAVDEAQTVINLCNLINSGTATVDDYTNGGLTGVKESNLSDINELMKDKNYKTLRAIQEAIDKIVNSLKNINEGNGALEDFNNLNITGLTADNLPFVKVDVANTKTSNGSDLNKRQIQSSVQYTLTYLSAMDKINAGNGTLDDYKLLGITSVTSENLSFVNDKVKGSNCKTVAELKAKVEEAVKLYESYKKANSGTATYEDYIRMNITITIEEVVEMNKILNGKNCFDLETVKTTINISKRVNLSFEHIKSGVATKEDYIIGGYQGVTDENIDYINRELKFSTGVTSDYVKSIITKININIEILRKCTTGQVTAADLKGLGLDIVNDQNISYVVSKLSSKTFHSTSELITYVKVILKEKETYERIDFGQGTIADYEYIKITGVNTTNISYINDYVKSCSLITRESLQIKVDAVIEQMEAKTHSELVLNRINLGRGNVVDYQFLGINIVTSTNLEYINLNLKGGSVTADSISKKVTVLVQEYSYYEKINKGDATLDIYTSLGITGVTTANLSYINVNIKGNEYYTVAEIQTRVNSVLSVYGYYQAINRGEATVDIYTSLGITAVTKVNISYVNTYIKQEQHFDLTSLNQSVQVMVERFNAYVNISLGKATVSDYVKIGVTSVTNENLTYINVNINLKDCFETALIQGRVTVLVKELSTYSRITQGAATIEDYAFIKVTGVTSENIKYINYALKGLSLNETVKIQAKIDEVLSIYVQLDRICSGTATVEDYIFIGISGVTEANLNYINNDIKGKGYLSVNEVKARVEKIFSIYTVIGRINVGEGTLSDYQNAGAVNVTAESLAYVNINIKGNVFESYEQIKAKVNAIVTQYEISIKIEQVIGRINLGTATIEDYNFIEITSVTDENIDAVNIDLKGKNYRDISTISARVNVIVKIQAAIKRINLGQGTLSDYSVLGITSVYKDILVYVNADLKGLNYTKIEEVQGRIDVKLNTYKILCKINLGEATISDYTSINVTGVDSTILVYINANLKGKEYKTVEEVQQRVNSDLNIYKALIRINAGVAVIDNYLLLGVNNIDSSILVYVNDDLRNKNYRTPEEIQQRINVKLNVYLALKRINNGQATINDYSTIGITGLDSSLLIYVNVDLKGKNYINADEVKVRIEQNLNIYQILKRVNDGIATLDDYSELGIPEVIDYNLEYVNVRIKASNLLTADDVIAKVQSILAAFQTGTVSGTVKDSSTGKALAGITVKFKIGTGESARYLTKDGVEIVATSDATGKYTIDLPDGSYTAEYIKSGYVTEYSVIVVSKASGVLTKETVLVPVRTDGKYSVVLTWGAAPGDLDSHLKGVTADGTSMYVDYTNKSFVKDGKVVASLDVDDTNSYGPETITFTADATGSYTYSVFDYTDKGSTTSTALSNSGAKVSVYKGSELVKTYIVSSNKSGLTWTVFEIKDGVIRDINSIA